MSNNANELKQCTRCHSTILLQYFDTNRKGEYYKTCRSCLTRDHKTKHEYYETNKDAFKEWTSAWKDKNREHFLEQKKKHREENKDYILETLICECGSSHIRNALARHLRTLKHIRYMEVQALIPKLDINDDVKAS